MGSSDYNAAQHQITYDYFCLLGGSSHPNTYRKLLPNGRFAYFLLP